jgi:predicted DNA-binding transcriptional regulator YafY
VRPLALAFFGPIWILSAWCELRDDFRSFRPDRIRRLDLLPDTFRSEPGKTLEEYMRRMGIDTDPV